MKRVKKKGNERREKTRGQKICRGENNRRENMRREIIRREHDG